MRLIIKEWYGLRSMHMIAFVIESAVPYKRLCKGLARQKGELAGHFKVFNSMETFYADSIVTHYSLVACYGDCTDVSFKSLQGDIHHSIMCLSLDDTEKDGSNCTLYQPFSQLLEKLVDLAKNKYIELNTKKIRLCYRFIHERRHLYDVIAKHNKLNKILVVDWMPVNQDELFESEEDGLLTYHLINNKVFNISDFRLVRNQNMTLYRPMLCLNDYGHFESIFPHKIHELCIKSGFDLCLYVEHIGFGPYFDLENQYGFDHQYILDGEKHEGKLQQSKVNEDHIKVCDSWERIFAHIDENNRRMD